MYKQMIALKLCMVQGKCSPMLPADQEGGGSGCLQNHLLSTGTPETQEQGLCQHPKRKAKPGCWDQGRERIGAKTQNPNNQEKLENKKSERKKRIEQTTNKGAR